MGEMFGVISRGKKPRGCSSEIYSTAQVQYLLGHEKGRIRFQVFDEKSTIDPMIVAIFL